MLRRLSATSVSLALLLAPRPAPAQDPATSDEAPAASEPETEAAEAEETEEIDGPLVHFLPLKPDESRGVLKLARHLGSSVAAVSSNAIVIANRYEEICSEPCGVRVDIKERPIFYFIRDGQPVSYGFRLNNLGDELTLRVKPTRTGLLVAGVTLAVFLIGIPMWIAAAPKVWASPGGPGQNMVYRRLKRART